jgi:hypothetical protein
VILTFPYTYEGHDVTVTVDYTPAVPANFNGHPNTWHDGQAAECELMGADGPDDIEEGVWAGVRAFAHLTDNPDELHRLALAAYMKTIS